MADTESINDTRWNNIVTQTAADFAENTTLNGLKYMAEKGATILERIFWITTFILSTVLCVMMVYKSYVKYDTSGVVVTLKEQLVSVNEYPFPAVTICPQARIKRGRYNYTLEGLSAFKDYFENRSAADLRKFHSILVLCDNDEGLDPKDSEWYPFLNYTIDIRNFFKVAPKHEDIFMECSWRNKVDCRKSFRPVLTADGICYTFNILATNEILRKSVFQERYYLNTSTPQKGWSLEKNYFSFENTTFPRRGQANAAKEDLYLTLREIPDRDFACDMQTRPGYKVYLHHPADLPQASLHSYAAQPGKSTSLAIKLDILETAEELAGYTPELRQCYFPDEKHLQYFQKYTSSNCHLECLANYTIRACQCVSFYMPRNESTDICKGDQYNCVQEALDEYVTDEDLNGGKMSQCQCLPSCKDVNYDADVFLSKLDPQEYAKREKEFNKLQKELYTDYNEEDEESYDRDPEYSDTNETNSQSDFEIEGDNNTVNDLYWFTEIRIYYRRPRFVAMERSELVGLSQFLADVGGTLGLFLGFSFLTLAEIFYFFTLKLYCKFQGQVSAKQEDKKSDTDNINL